MYLAELHGKLSRDNENKEDILTSNVFSFFKYANREIFLFEFIKLLGLKISSNDAINAEFRFWPTFEDNTEPDLVMIIGKYYLLFEAKYHSGFGKETQDQQHQIVREIKGGKFKSQNLEKVFKIIAVTAHYSDVPEIKRDIPKEYLENLKWTNWQTIALLIYQQIEKNPTLSVETKVFATDLYELLVRKKLRNFEGVKVFSIYPAGLRTKSDNIFFEAKTASYRGAFLGFTATMPDLRLIRFPSTAIFWNPQKRFFETLVTKGRLTHPTETMIFKRRTNE